MKKSIFKITAFSIIAVLVVALSVTAFALTAPGGNVTTTGDSVSYAETKNNNPYIVYNTTGVMRSAHRAGGVLDPENTMQAIKTCINNSDYDVDILEFDLHLTKDNKLILLHDENFDRTTNSVEVWGREGVLPRDKDLAEIKELNFGYWFPYERGSVQVEDKRIYKDLGKLPKGIDANDLRVVTLEDVFKEVGAKKTSELAPGESAPKIKYNFIIEIKDKGSVGKYAAEQLCELMNDYNLLDKVVVGTFNGEISDYFDYLNTTDELYKGKINPYKGKINRSAGILEVLKIFLSYLMNRDLGDVKYNVLQIPYMNWFPFLGSKSFIDYAHKYGIACQFWTINEASQMETLIKNGADCIMSDNPKLLDEVTKRVEYGNKVQPAEPQPQQ